MGYCREVNLTKENVRNIIENNSFLFDLQGAQTREQTLVYLDWSNNNLKLVPVTDRGDYNELYEAAGSVIVPERVSSKGHKKYKKSHPNDTTTLDKERQREAGIKIHKNLQNIFDFLANKKGDFNDIKKIALSGPFAITEVGFNNLVKGVKEIIAQLEGIQNKINIANGTNEKVIFRVEQKVIDSVEGIAGAMDVMALFSDNTAAIIDYKTINVFNEQQARAGFVTENRIDTYNLTVGEYKRILIERIGIKAVRLSRVAPIQIQLELKPRLAQKQGDVFNDKLTIVKIGGEEEHLAQIPVANEETEYRGLNTQLNKQLGLIKSLEDKLTNKALSSDDKQIIQHRILNIKKSMRKILVKGEIKGLILDANEVLNAFRSRINEPELLTSLEPNPLYLTQDEVRAFIEELTVYDDIIKNTNDYLEDFKKLDPVAYKENIRLVGDLSKRINSALNKAHVISQKMSSELVPEQFKDTAGNLIPQLGLGWGARTFSNLSEINHPLFIAFNNLKDSATYDIREDNKKFFDELEVKVTALLKWGKEHGYNLQEVYDFMINRETGNLTPMFKQEVYDIQRKAIKNKDIKTLKSIYKHRFETDELYLEDLKKSRDKYSKWLLGRYNNLEDSVDSDGTTLITKAEYTRKYKKDMEKWDEQNNLIKSPDAWLNYSQYEYHKLIIKPDVHDQYMTDEYKYLKNNAVLFDFYKFFENKIALFRETLGESYDDIPPNFIPNIRKDLIEKLIDNKSLIQPLKEIFQSFNVREEDIYISNKHTSTGERERQIPKMFINKFNNKDEKSFNLGRVLMLFANMTYQYEHLSTIEAHALALKDMLGNPSSQQGGELAQDRYGNPIPGVIGGFATIGDKKSSETYRLLEDFIDYYVYGIKFKESSLLKKYDTTKILLKLKNYLSLKQLAFAVIPSSGALVAGQANAWLESKKGTSFDTKQLHNSYKLLATDRQKMLAIAGFFDVYSEDPLERMAINLSTRRVDEYLSNRFAFGLLRRTDENITETVITSMIQNWGIDSKGNLTKLNVPGKDYTSVKSIIDLAVYNKEKKTIEIKGANKNTIITFRSAVKSTMKNIIGNMSSEDVARYDLSLGLSLLMQFKTWMPAIVQDRFGGIKYDDTLQALRQGRYAAYSTVYNRTSEEIKDGMALGGWLSKIVLPNAGKLAFDVFTFGIAPSLSNKYMNKDRAFRHYVAWRVNTEKTQPLLAAKVTFEEYLDMKQRQTRTMINELRLVTMFAMMLMFLGGDDPETGKPIYSENRVTRLMAKVLGKANSELAMIANPGQFFDLVVNNPIPLAKLAVDVKNTVKNTFDESRDYFIGENATNDPTPEFYYLSQWLIGGTQIARFTELFETYKQNPYYK